MFAGPPLEAGIPPFQDRCEAGKLLAGKLTRYADRQDVQVLALPRGGAPVAFEIALAIRAPLDIFVVRKLGVPGHEELAMGAVASGNVRTLQENVVDAFHISSSMINEAATRELRELSRREQIYRSSRPPPEIRGRAIIIVDDGLATGASMRAAVSALKQQRPARTIIAVPVAAPEVCNELKNEVDEIICLKTPSSFCAVGNWYEDFSQVTDEEVRDLLARLDRKRSAGFTATRGS